MKNHSQVIFCVTTLAILVGGCFGKLADEDAGSNGDLTGCVTADGGPAVPFIGSWTCNTTTTSTTDQPGTRSTPVSATETVRFAYDDGGGGRGLLMTIGGVDEAPTCEALRFTVSGETATLLGVQSCYDVENERYPFGLPRSHVTSAAS